MKKVRLFLYLIFLVNIEEYVAAMAENYSAPTQKTVVAGPESTVYGIAYEHGIPTQALIAANNLQSPYVLQIGQILIIPLPNQHIVGRGETLNSIANNYGVNVDVLAQENERQVVRSGEHMLIPSRDTVAVKEALRSPADNNISTSTLAPLPSVNPSLAIKPTVMPSSISPSSPLPNELAKEIAQEKSIQYEVSKADSTSNNTVPSPSTHSKVDTSQPLLMGNLAQRNAGAPIGSASLYQEEEKAEKSEKEIKKVSQRKEESEENKEKSKNKEKSQEIVSQEKSDHNEPQFIWPVQGTIVNKFQPGKNDGIKIKIAEGTPVRAAMAGDVLYAGNELKGFGNLILLRHKEGWVTAYAYNSILLVKKGDSIKQGQAIAKSGKTGDAKQPQLHFEIRKGKQPIDPLTQLKS